MSNNMKDTIHHSTHHKFKLWDRIKILFGKELTVCSEIETEHEEVLLTGNVKCTTSVAVLSPRKFQSLSNEKHTHKDVVKLSFSECQKILPMITYGEYQRSRLLYGLDKIIIAD